MAVSAMAPTIPMEQDPQVSSYPNTISHAQLQRIRLFATDVDGVLTDGGMYYGDSGQEWKKFHVHDGMGLVRLREAGLITAFITAEQTQLVALRGAKLGIPEIHQGIRDKLKMVQSLAAKYGMALDEIAYMGDDVNDLSALQAVGFSAAPANAVSPVKQCVHYVCRLKGGDGAVREIADLLLTAQHPEMGKEREVNRV